MSTFDNCTTILSASFWALSCLTRSSNSFPFPNCSYCYTQKISKALKKMQRATHLPLCSSSQSSPETRPRPFQSRLHGTRAVSLRQTFPGAARCASTSLPFRCWPGPWWSAWGSRIGSASICCRPGRVEVKAELQLRAWRRWRSPRRPLMLGKSRGKTLHSPTLNCTQHVSSVINDSRSNNKKCWAYQGKVHFCGCLDRQLGHSPPQAVPGRGSKDRQLPWRSKTLWAWLLGGPWGTQGPTWRLGIRLRWWAFWRYLDSTELCGVIRNL